MEPNTSAPQAPVPVPQAPISQTTITSAFEGPVALFKFGWKLLTNHWKMLAPILLLPTIIMDVATLIMRSGNGVGAVLGLLLIIVGVILSIASVSALANAVHRVSIDPTTKINLKEQYKFGFSYFWSYILVAIIGGFVFFGSTVLLIIPGIIISMYTCVYLYAFVVDGKKGFSAFTESYSLVRNRWWPVVGRILFFILVVLVIYIIIVGINFLISLIFGVPAVPVGSATVPVSLGMMITTMIVSLFTNTIIGLISVGYTYRMYISLKATRDQSISTVAFRKWLIAFVCVGVIGVILMFISLPAIVLTALNSARSKAQEASVTAQARMAAIQQQIDAENLGATGTSTLPVQK